jgi:hypothetical protein
VRVGQHLRLDVARLVEVALDEALAAPERGDGLADRRLVELADLLALPRDLHPASAAAERGLDRDREPVLVGEGLDLVRAGHRFRGAGDERRARARGDVPGGDLVAEIADGLRGGPDPGDPCVDHGLGELGVLGEEAVAGVDTVGACRARRPDHLVEVEVGLGRRGAAQRERLVGQPHERGIAVGVRVHGDARDPGVATGPDDSDCDLPAVGDEDLAQARHGRPPGVACPGGPVPRRSGYPGV